MDSRRRIEWQIRVIEITYRTENRRLNSETMRLFRERARALLEEVAGEASAYPDLRDAVAELRQELDDADSV